MAGSYKINSRLEYSRLDARIAKLAKAVGKSREEIVRTATRFFGQSVVKLTPQTKIKKRTIEEFQSDGKKKRKRYRVVSRGYSGKKEHWFGRKSEAVAMSKIHYRGVGKYGWKVAVETALNEMLSSPQRFGESVAKVRSAVGRGMINKNSPNRTFAEINNTAQRIARYGEVLARQALVKTNSRLYGWWRNIVKKQTQGV